MANELASATVAPATAPQPAPAAGQIPEQVAAVAAGQIPGLLVPPARKGTPPDPVYMFLVENYDLLPDQAPVDFYETANADTVIFNTGLLTQDDLAAAEEAGTLAEILIPSQAAEQPTEASQGFARTAEGTSVAPPQVSAPAMPARAQASLAGARVRNMQGGPKVSPIQPNPIGQQLARRAV
jgi:hypothetical protein